MVEVVDDLSGEPLALADLQVVRLAGLDGGGEQAPVATGRTDSSGRFTFGELPGEACLIRALRPGYRVNALAAHPPAVDRRELSHLEIRLTPLD